MIAEWSLFVLTHHTHKVAFYVAVRLNFGVHQENNNAWLKVPDQLPAIRGSFSLSQPPRSALWEKG